MSDSAQVAVSSAHESTRDIVELVYHRLLTVIAVLLIGTPVSILVYRYLSWQLLDTGKPSATS